MVAIRGHETNGYEYNGEIETFGDLKMNGKFSRALVITEALGVLQPF